MDMGKVPPEIGLEEMAFISISPVTRSITETSPGPWCPGRSSMIMKMSLNVVRGFVKILGEGCQPNLKSEPSKLQK
jgi:hypothetical protein